MNLIFVHGWGTSNTDTYGGLPEALVTESAGGDLGLTIQHINLGRYVSFRDEVTLDDITRGMNQALHDLPGNENGIHPFSCITHSTGGPVVRHWVNRFYGSQGLGNLPLQHLIMLAPANHGSSLAVLGKKRVSRIKSWFEGIEPGQRVLDWLSFGSKGQWSLNEAYLSYDYSAANFYPFVLTGQGIDHKFYDFINNYLVEDGSDGVIRVAGANLNYRYFAIKQSSEAIRQKPKISRLVADPNRPVRTTSNTPLRVYNNYSHCGKKMGIMACINPQNAGSQPLVADILTCLQVADRQGYENLSLEFDQATTQEQAGGSKFAMLIFNIQDDQGNQFDQDDFDVFLLAGSKFSPTLLPKGFFKDRQINAKTNNLVYYLDADKMREIKDGMFGIRIVARPSSGFSRYDAAEFRSDGAGFEDIVVPNQTTYVDITLTRQVDRNVFRFARGDEPRGSFKKTKPLGVSIDVE